MRKWSMIISALAALAFGGAAIASGSAVLAALGGLSLISLLLSLFLSAAMLPAVMLGFIISLMISVLTVIAVAPRFGADPPPETIGIIGGADGPTEIYVTDDEEPAEEEAMPTPEPAPEAVMEETEEPVEEAVVPEAPSVSIVGISVDGGEDEGVRLAVPSRPEIFSLITTIELDEIAEPLPADDADVPASPELFYTLRII